MEHKPLNFEDDQIDFRELFKVLWDGKWLLITTTSLFALGSIIYSLYLPNIYQSSALLSPVVNENSMNQSMKNVGGLASLAGINIQSQSGNSNTIKAIQKLRTLSFFEKNILPNIFLPNLLAVESWNSSTNNISYNNSLYNEISKTWTREAQHPKTQIPSAQEAFAVFMNEHLSLSIDPETGFVTISIKHKSPFIAKAWTELVVKEINSFFRIKDEAEAMAALNFLNAQISQTTFTEIKQVIAQLLQQKTQQLTLIEVSDFYVFEYIDPPAVMERKSEPKRSIISILGTFLGAIIAVLIVLIRYYVLKKEY
jgi:LPS O-antigen subunit length determinant protein (WzzB/FepE family)